MRTVALVLLAGCLGLQGVVVSPGLQHGRKQMPSPPIQVLNSPPVTVVGNSPYAEIQDPVQREQRARYNAEQHSKAMADARRLAQLARELQNELEHADGLTLPADTFRKADEIIKLAKSVKGKMQPH